jgi:hypothetical protein
MEEGAPLIDTVDLLWPGRRLPRFDRGEATVATCPDDIEASAILPATRSPADESAATRLTR